VRSISLLKPRQLILCSSGVGTSLYIAPETLSRGRIERSVKYSNKIDSELLALFLLEPFADMRRATVYSLGIVFFEMFHPAFKTGMERIHVRRRSPSPTSQVLIALFAGLARVARTPGQIPTYLGHRQARSTYQDHPDLPRSRSGASSFAEGSSRFRIATATCGRRLHRRDYQASLCAPSGFDCYPELTRLRFNLQRTRERRTPKPLSPRSSTRPTRTDFARTSPTTSTTGKG